MISYPISQISKSSFRTVFYLRLSKEDKKTGESDSISNQRLILQHFLKSHPDLQFFREYIDDGKSGTHFNRPGFSKMMEDLDHKLFDCILCKDCSRFGRDYIECGSYIRSFDQSGIRFIAVNDQYDSFDPNRDDTIFAIKNVINTQYSQNKSKELKKLFKEKQYSGQYMGAFSVYGYQKDTQEKHRFLIDPYAASVVQRIFSLFCSGMKQQSIARLLTDEGVLPPEEYKHASGSRFCTGRSGTFHGWSYGTIHTMLSNPVYLGSTVQNKTYRRSLRGKAHKTSVQDWIIVEHTHEPIVDMTTWEKTQRLLKQRNGRSPDFSSVSAFAGFLKCADCGASLSSGHWGKQSVFLCGTYKRFGRSYCSPHLVPKQLLYDFVLDDINQFLQSYPDFSQKLIFFADHFSQKMALPPDSAFYENANIEARYEKITAYKKKIFELYSDHLISLSDFLQLQNQYAQEERQLEQRKKNLPSSTVRTSSPWICEFLQSQKLTVLDRSIVADTIDSILVSEGNKISIFYRF